MLWFLLAVGSALALSTADAMTKKYFSHLSTFNMGYIRFFFGAPWLIVPLLTAPVPVVPLTSWLWLLILIPLEIMALLLYMRALQASPLSLSIPFLAFTPVWMIFVGWFILGELPNIWGGAGIIVVAAGAYVLNLDVQNQGVFEPIKAIFREPGSKMMLLVSVIYAVTATMGKKLILVFGVTYFGTMYFLLITIVLTAVFRWSGKIQWSTLLVRPGWGLLVGFCYSAMLLTHVWAISMAPVAYMIAVKRVSLVFAVLYGRVLFRETQFKQRLTGAAIMFVGLAMITIWG